MAYTQRKLYAKGNQSFASGTTDQLIQSTTYIRSLFDPEGTGPQHYPDLDFTPNVLKTIRIESSEFTQAPTGLFLVTLGSYGAKLRWYIQNTSDLKFYFYKEVKPNQDLAESFLSCRTTAGKLLVKSATTAAGAFSLSGVFYSVAVMSLPDITNEITVQNVTQYAKNTMDVCDATAEEGIINLWQPTGSNPFQTPVSPGIQTISETIQLQDRGFLAGTKWTAAGYDSNTVGSFNTLPNNAFGGFRISVTLQVAVAGLVTFRITRTAINATGTALIPTYSSTYSFNFVAGQGFFQWSEDPSFDTLGPVTRIEVEASAPTVLTVPGCIINTQFFDRNQDNYVDPSTLIVYSGVTIGQQMLISGQINMEAVPNEQLAKNVSLTSSVTGTSFDFVSSFLAKREQYGFPFVLPARIWLSHRFQDAITPPLVASGFTDLLKTASKFLPIGAEAIGTAFGVPGIGGMIGQAASSAADALFAKGANSLYSLGNPDDELAFKKKVDVVEGVLGVKRENTLQWGWAGPPSDIGPSLSAARTLNQSSMQLLVGGTAYFPSTDMDGAPKKILKIQAFSGMVDVQGDESECVTMTVKVGAIESVFVTATKVGTVLNEEVVGQLALAVYFAGFTKVGATFIFPDLDTDLFGISAGLAAYMALTGQQSPYCIYSGGLFIDDEGYPDLLPVAGIAGKEELAVQSKKFLVTPGRNRDQEILRFRRAFGDSMRVVIEISNISEYQALVPYLNGGSFENFRRRIYTIQEVKTKKGETVVAVAAKKVGPTAPKEGITAQTVISGKFAVRDPRYARSAKDVPTIEVPFEVTAEATVAAINAFIKSKDPSVQYPIAGSLDNFLFFGVLNRSKLEPISAVDLRNGIQALVVQMQRNNEKGMTTLYNSLLASSYTRYYRYINSLKVQSTPAQTKPKGTLPPGFSAEEFSGKQQQATGPKRNVFSDLLTAFEDKPQTGPAIVKRPPPKVPVPTMAGFKAAGPPMTLAPAPGQQERAVVIEKKKEKDNADDQISIKELTEIAATQDMGWARVGDDE